MEEPTFELEGERIEVELPPEDEPDVVTKRRKCGPKAWLQCMLATIVVVAFMVVAILFKAQDSGSNLRTENLEGNNLDPRADGPTPAPKTPAPTTAAPTSAPTSAPTAVPTAAPTGFPIEYASTLHACLLENFTQSDESPSSWHQIVTDVIGEGSFDFAGFGLTMSGDGSVIAIGAPENDGNGLNAGHVRVYRITENEGTTEYIKLGEDLDGILSKDKFGDTVALSMDGLRLAAGASWNDGVNASLTENIGHVRIFDYEASSDSWTQVGQALEGDVAKDYAGRSIALSADGSMVAVGIVGGDGADDNKSDSGHVRMYRLEQDEWTQVGNDILGEDVNDLSGSSVAMSYNGRRVAVGAIFHDGDSSTDDPNVASGRGGTIIDVGQVKIYDYRTATDSWEQVGQNLEGRLAGDLVGSTVALSSNGRFVVVGFPGDGSRFLPGLSKVYEYNRGNETWVQLGSDLEGGFSVDISQDGKIVAVGDYKGFSTGINAGHVNVYELNDDGSDWVLMGSTIAGSAGEMSGYSVSLAGDGKRIANAAPLSSQDGMIYVGVTRVYDFC